MSKELRRKLRRNPTAAEKAFWRLLHPLRTDGWHFRKQVELGSYYVDFACLHAGLVIEIDGHSHGSDLARLNDETRNAYLAARGFKVIRFSNEDVLHNSEGVFLVVRAALGGTWKSACKLPLPNPPRKGEGAGR